MQKIIAAGGHGGNDQGDGGFPLNTVEVYDISLNTWQTGVYDNDHIKEDVRKEHSKMVDYHPPAQGTMEIIPPEDPIIPPEACIIPPEGRRRPKVEAARRRDNAGRGRNNGARRRNNFHLARGMWGDKYIIT